MIWFCFKELNLCFRKLVSRELHTLYCRGFPSQGMNLGPWSQALNRQQYMAERSFVCACENKILKIMAIKWNGYE